MIAEVYPITRLPRRFSFFDYRIPEGKKVNVGDLVRIPLRGREVYGIVKQVKANSEAVRLVDLVSVVRSSYLQAPDIERYERIALCIAQSVSSLLHTTLPNAFQADSVLRPFPDRGRLGGTISRTVSLAPSDLPIIERCLSEINQQQSVAITGDRDLGFVLTYALRKKRSGQMLILLPRERDAELLAQYIALGDSTAILHGKTRPKERAQVIEAWRSGKLQTLIGTRQASLLPAKQLSTVVVLESGNAEHVNERRNPRFDAREAVKLLVAQHGANLIMFDAFPRLEELASMPRVSCAPNADHADVIDLRSADEITDAAMLSDSVLFGIETALQNNKNALLFLNRKGVAKRLQCGACGHIPTCGTCGYVPAVRHDDLACTNCGTEMWIPKTCPACNKPKLGLRGIGGAKIESVLKERFPEASIGRIEKGSLANANADILIVTEYFFSSYLEPFSRKRFGLVADLAADIALHAGNFRGAEETARKMHRLINFARQQGAKALFQTWVPDLLRPMLDLETFIPRELDLRQQFNLPPFTGRLVLEHANIDDLTAELKDRAIERDEHLEIIPYTPPISPYHFADTIKLTYDGTYAKTHESTP